MIKRVISILLTLSFVIALIPAYDVLADSAETVEISNQYIKVTVNSNNGGYVISTLEGDILKKSDDNVLLTHRGKNFDTSFTSFKIGDDEYVFGEKYGIFGTETTDVSTSLSPDGESVVSTWSVGDFTAEQKIILVNNDQSEQLGTAMITYTVKNNGTAAKNVKSRILMDTQLGENDFGYYEIPKQNLGQGYEYFEYERTWDSHADPTVKMPSDYFVRDNPYSSSIVGYGVNSVFTEQKPYKMTFAHWANIASTIFDYTPDEKLNFTNSINDLKTADSAAALYYNLKSVEPGEEKSFSTYYGVTANLKNKDNKIIINTTAPSKLEFKDDTRTAYKGSEADVTDNVVRINVNLTNPSYSGKDYKNLAVTAYALGFDTQRQTDAGEWIKYSNSDPVFTEIIDFKSGENRVTYFDFKFTPLERAQLGTFVIKVFDIDSDVNELGSYAEEYCLGTTENHIILPGTDKNLPAITLTGLAPEIVYNSDVRYLTVSGRGMNFLRSDLLNKIELRGENGKTYEIPIENLTVDQGADPAGTSIMLEEYMEPGAYTLHFLWKSRTGESALENVPDDFTSDAMTVHISSDKKYSNACYGVVTLQRGEGSRYKVVAYKTETAFENASVPENDLLLSFRGDILKDRTGKNLYRLFGKDKDVNINHILNYHGDELTIEEKENGTAEVLMNGKITTVGANTTVRNGTAAFRLNGGTKYVIPEYSEDGETDTSLSAGQDFIELKWDNAFDTLTTVGGFLIDMKYGVLGKINDDEGNKTDIISFGGSLDLGFMTPGGAAAVRQNTAAGARWTTDYEEINHDDMDDGYTFGLTFDEDAGEFRSQVKEVDVEPANQDADRVEAGATIHDVLFGGKDPGYIGINMDAHIALPQLVKFLPQKIEGELSINTINGYNVGVNANVETGAIALALSLVVRSSPNGAPIPDKLFFSIGGFEPGINVDGLGIVWVTGGGGGFDNLYDTIYGKDGIPPLTLLMHVEFDITKILTGNADLELSLRSLKVSFDDLSLKKLKDAKFVDGGEIAVGWYPNFSLNLSAGVNFAQIMSGRLTITAAAGKDTADFVQFVLNVSIGLPKYIPIVGGMELASAELGGGSQKVWGAVTVLSLIKVGFTYYWGKGIEFTHGSASGLETFAVLSPGDDEGVVRTKALYNAMIAPVQVGTDPDTGEKQFASIGKNLLYSAGSTAIADFDERLAAFSQPGIRLMSANKTEILTNGERTKHIVTFGDTGDYIISVSRADGSEITEADLKNSMKITQNNAPFELRYYKAPAHGASDSEKQAALENANINISGKAAYIAIPKGQAADMLVEFSDGNAYDLSAIKVKPMPVLKPGGVLLDGKTLKLSWDGENLSDSAKIIVTASEGGDLEDVVLNEKEIFAKDKSAEVKIPDELASGEYTITLTLSDEDVCSDSYRAGNITVINTKAPDAPPQSVSAENFGDCKLKVTVNTKDKNFDGYLVEVYEDGALADTGLYFDKDKEIIVGGRYEMPVLDEQGKPIDGKSVPIGYTPGKQYSVKVRLCNIEDDLNANARGDEIYHCTPAVTSAPVTLNESTPPKITLGYKNGEFKILSNVPVSGELYINSAVENGEWYEFSDKNAEHSQKVNLPDGDYTVEFYAVDENGNHAIIKDIITVDTTPPALLIAAPVSGGTFEGNSVTVSMSTDDPKAEYLFKVNGSTVSPNESNIFDGKLLKCTLPLGAAADCAKINLEITAKDKHGNSAVKNIVLTNKKLSEITSVRIESTDRELSGGKLALGENEMANLKVTGILENGKTLDITDAHGTALEISGGTSAALDGTKVTALLAGQTLIKASFSLGGNEFLYDGAVIEVTDKALIYSALDEAIAQAEQITNDGYTDSSWNALSKALEGAKQIRNTKGATQNDIDMATTALQNAIAGLKTKSSGGTAIGNGISATYTVSFNTNGGSAVESQKVKSGGKLEQPKTPVKNGYIFDGWYTDKEFKSPYGFDLRVTKSFTLYAKWIEDTEITFNDVSKDDWFYENVEYAVKNGLFGGIGDKTFDPNGRLTRAMLVTVLWRAEGKPAADYVIPFTDTDSFGYYAEALRWAAENGIVNGYSQTQFAPDDYITREQLCAIMHRYAQYKGYDVSTADNTDISSYTDAESISEYAVSAVKYAVGTGLIKGKSATEIMPGDNTTRAEAAAILQRFIEGNN